MKMKLLALAVLAGGSMFAQSRFSVGVQVGGYGPGYYSDAPVYAEQRPPCPGPDYDWVSGYWGQNYGRRAWVGGYWNRRPFEPRYEGRYNGYREREYREHEYREHEYREHERREHERREEREHRDGGYWYRGR